MQIKNLEILKYFLLCQLHKEEFSYFCLECGKNICRKCLRKTNKHKGHKFKLFDNICNEIDPIVEFIENNLKKREEESNENSDFIKLMTIIIDVYNNYPNISHFEIISSCENLLKKKNYQDTYEKSIKYINIKNENELNYHLNNIQNIKTISINEGNPHIIEKLKIAELINLTELNLSDNNINNIKLLTNIKLVQLKELNLAINKIDDSNIEYFSKLDFPNLTDLNIYQNKSTDPEILKFQNKSKNLPSLN